VASAQILLERGKNIKEVAPHIKEVLERELENIEALCLELANGAHPVC
jgi:hypothetical protein